jgi:hypothetical protein
MTPDLEASRAIGAAKALGMEITTTIVKRYELGIEFLGRRYSPGVWDGDVNSCADIRRQLAKFHCTTPLGAVTGMEKFLAKATSLAYTDADTPGLGEIVTKFKSLAQECSPNLYMRLRNYYSTTEATEQWPNVYEPWMTDLLNEQMPGFNLAALRTWAHDPESDALVPPTVWINKELPDEGAVVNGRSPSKSNKKKDLGKGKGTETKGHRGPGRKRREKTTTTTEKKTKQSRRPKLANVKKDESKTSARGQAEKPKRNTREPGARPQRGSGEQKKREHTAPLHRRKDVGECGW